MDIRFQPAGKFFTVSEYWALGETEYRCELSEGMIVPRPSPSTDHQMARMELWCQINAQLPTGFKAVCGVDVDLRLVPPDEPGFCRCPDLSIVSAPAIGTELITASQVHLIAEIASTGTRRLDYHVKRSEYADAGIANYWILDLDEPVSLLACHLTEEFGYVDSGEATGTFTTTEPVPLAIDLTTLLD